MTQPFEGGRAKNFVVGLFDFRFRTMSALDAAPWIYLIAILGSLVAWGYGAYWGFTQSTATGLLWSLLIGPAIFVGVTVVTRLVIEFVLAILLLFVRLSETRDAVVQIVENTTDISAQTMGLPTVPSFARGIKNFVVGTDEGRERRRAAAKAQQARAEARASAELAADIAVATAVDEALKRTLEEAAHRAVQRSMEQQAATEEAVLELAVEATLDDDAVARDLTPDEPLDHSQESGQR